ncbi:hypothetical protein BOTBODRAFT_170619 [Botryobasidium botryosum FD-172 SS1]|uniref:Uncharacterized protein n=1 Tax=Botryobasidium botryosum (strain FD-172 SS1) TaxID=930990 RepID=A0A067MVA6_BOTB1|nr:hypothetical protein BOTBODRAFT_170619 [Botryobasidium botryosum FD-172 SS1]
MNDLPPPGPAEQQQQLTLPSPIVFADSIANSIGLSVASRADLHVFQGVASHQPEDEQHVELFKAALSLCAHELLQQQSADFKSIQDVLKQVQQAMNDSVMFTEIQKAEARAVCCVAVWNPVRVDYSNSTISNEAFISAQKYLEKHCKSNDFEDFFKSTSQVRKKALSTLLSTNSSYAKGLLKDHVRAGIFPNPKKGLVSLMASVKEGMRRFTDESFQVHAIIAFPLHNHSAFPTRLLIPLPPFHPPPPPSITSACVHAFLHHPVPDDGLLAVGHHPHSPTGLPLRPSEPGPFLGLDLPSCTRDAS